MGTRGEERLKAITDAATEVVAERGYYGMTIQEVSDRVGITQQIRLFLGQLAQNTDTQARAGEGLTPYNVLRQTQFRTQGRSHRPQSPGARVLRPAWRTAARADRQLSVEAAARI